MKREVSAQWDEKGYTSIMPLRRYWHRRRFAIIAEWAQGERIVDIGCGSSVIVQKIPNCIGVDISEHKLRHLNHRGIPLIQADAHDLPFKSGSVDCLISSQVIEHLDGQERLFSEMRRVLKPNGRLIIGTPDYATIWKYIEPIYGFCAPNGYHGEHITHYTKQTLDQTLTAFGFEIQEHRYVAKAEIIVKCRKASIDMGLHFSQ